MKSKGEKKVKQKNPKTVDLSCVNAGGEQLTLLISGDLTRAPSASLKATFRANWMARPVIVPVDRGSILVTALTKPALVRCVFRDT